MNSAENPTNSESDVITPDYVRALNAPTDRFLVRLSENWPKLSFKGFSIRDMASNITLVDVPNDELSPEDLLRDEDDPSKRLIKYHMGPDFLRLHTVGLKMNFGIGPKPI